MILLLISLKSDLQDEFVAYRAYYLINVLY